MVIVSRRAKPKSWVGKKIQSHVSLGINVPVLTVLDPEGKIGGRGAEAFPDTYERKKISRMAEIKDKVRSGRRY